MASALALLHVSMHSALVGRSMKRACLRVPGRDAGKLAKRGLHALGGGRMQGRKQHSVPQHVPGS